MSERPSLLRWIFGRPRLNCHRIEHLHNLLHTLNQKVNTIMATQAEVAAELRRLLAQNEKARAENQLALQALRDAIKNAGGSTPEVDAALQALAESIQGEDDENPDEPESPPVV